jgi:hypothetical protein
MVNYDKPLTLSLLTYIMWVLALVIITLTVYVFFLVEGDFWGHGILQYMPSEFLSFIVIIVFCLLMIFAGIGLLTESGAGRGLLMVLCIIVVLHGILILLDDFTRGFIVTAIGAVVFVYMLKSDVAEVFQPIDSRKTVNALDTLESYRNRNF